ncbi:MAG: 2Fe-2S iron-sulfur cluster-binding protein [Armatimonadetes bacterium]|nr:2Fe-2S iron-sulfur cluster-binding protein [Armatimonadota bacterium]
MPNITIDNKQISVEPGATILDAANKLGVKIPTLCYLRGHSATTSCMICVVKVNGGSNLVPACATVAQEGMAVESDSDDVHSARRMALELLLGDHTGDCVGPCQSACPAHMDIPLMITHLSRGEHHEAIKVIKDRIALPAALGRICPEICEKVCRRGIHDAPVSICLLKRFAADVDLQSGSPYMPECKPATGKRAAIIGSGPTGLSAAYYLIQEGIACAIFDSRPEAGGALRYEVSKDRLPNDVLDAEIAIIQKMGAKFELNSAVTGATLEHLHRDYDAVLLAIGKIEPERAQALDIQMTAHGVKVDKHTMMTGALGIFAAGAAVVPSKLAVRSVGEGRAAAHAIAHHIFGKPIKVHDRPFTVRMGHITDEEMAVFMAYASSSGRTKHSGNGLTPNDTSNEAERCLHCECSKLRACKLRDWAIEYDASPNTIKGRSKKLERYDDHPEIIFEPGKCISCGICIAIAKDAGEPLGLTFIGRGFDVQVGVPFSEPLSKGLRKAAKKCAQACPTGALALKEQFQGDSK